jgi:hypothetical protein
MRHKTREMLVSQRTQLLNGLRGHLTEIGVIAPQGLRCARELAGLIEACDERIPVEVCEALADMGDPRGCAGHMHRILRADGTWMIVEPIAGDRPEDNMNPVGRLYYNASTMICVPTSLDQEVGEGLGAQAGETKLTEVIRDGGFTQVRRATAGPFNMVLEARA